MLKAFLRTSNGMSALFFLGFGLLTLILSLQYRIGTPARMGPGFFPACLGGLLALLGLVLAVQTWRGAREEMPPVEWRAILSVTIAVLLAGVMIERAGLIPAVFVLVFVSAFADRGFHPLRAALTGAVLAFVAWFIFIYALGLRMSAWGF